MRNCELMTSLFGWSLFLKVSIWDFSCNHCTEKRCYFETGDIVLVVEN